MTDAQTVFAGTLKILKGIEFGEPHQYPVEFEAMKHQDYDLIIGSIHLVDALFVGSKQILERYALRPFYERYYTVILEAARCGGFDTLAHFDFPRRYLQRSSRSVPTPITQKILEQILMLLSDCLWIFRS